MGPRSERKITLKDVARLANVSIGTVDRVVHGRGRVALDSKERVEQILKEHNYQPNLLARSLSSRKKYRLLCLLPKHQRHEYWASVVDGIYQAQVEVSDHHVKVEFLFFDQYDNKTFETAVHNIMDKALFDGVLVSPLFKEEALVLVEHLRSKKIPCVFIDSNIDAVEGVPYFGQHSFQSGVVAANLMVTHVKSPATILACRLHRGKIVESNQTENRMLGAATYFQAFCKGYQILSLDLFIENEHLCHKMLDDAFKKYQNVAGILTFNSRAFVIANYLEKRKLTNQIALIGYDLLESNVAHLKNGNIMYLIAQRPSQQGYMAIKALTSQLMFGTQISDKQHLPIDILNKYNVDYYHKV